MSPEDRGEGAGAGPPASGAPRTRRVPRADPQLRSAAPAEDVVQETWLRWAGADRSDVRDARAFLVRIVTRQALNRLRSLSRRRETYVGPWLPEPLLTAPDVAEDVELADSVSTAMLLVLETLTPTERAVFVLREVFDLGYDEIAAAVGRSRATLRQVAHRGRAPGAGRRPRVEVSRDEQQAVLERFLRATTTGDLQGLVDVLAEDVVLTSDGGGLKKAALRPIVGRDKVLRFLVATAPRTGLGVEPALVNGAPALLLSVDGQLDSVVSFALRGGRVSELYFVRNPEKLATLTRETVLRR